MEFYINTLYKTLLNILYKTLLIHEWLFNFFKLAVRCQQMQSKVNRVKTSNRFTNFKQVYGVHLNWIIELS